MQNHPITFLRQFPLASEDGGIGWDKMYSLVFTIEGVMFVRVEKIFEQPYKTPDIIEVYPAEFAKVLVADEPLSKLVVEKLKEILQSPK